MSEISEVLVKRLADEGYTYTLTSRPECPGKVGFLVALEGIDGAGISTHANILVKVLQGLRDPDDLEKPTIFYTKEPTYGNVGFLVWQAIRKMVSDEYRTPQVMTLLFAADRLYHLLADRIENHEDYCNGIYECLTKPGIVVTDRYLYSSLVYQSLPAPITRNRRRIIVQPPSMEWIRIVNQYAPPPHVAVLIDVETEEALKEIVRERSAFQLYETKIMLDRVRRNFRKVFEEFKVYTHDFAPDSEPPWAQLLRAFHHITPECLYPPPWAYPSVHVIQRREDVADTAYVIAKTVLDSAASAELIKLGH